MATDIDNPATCETLLVCAGRGDTAAFAELYDRTAPAVFSLVRSLLPDVAQAEQITLDAYFQLWRAAIRYEPADGNAVNLLMTLAQRRALQRIRTTWTEPPLPAPRLPAPSDERLDATTKDMSSAQLLDTVPVDARAVLVLTHFRGHTVAEAAELLGIAESTASSRLDDALQSLRQNGLADVVGDKATTYKRRPRERRDAR